MLRKISSLAMIAIFSTRLSSLAYAGPTEDASAVIDQWVAAFNSGDVEKMVATYAPDATLHGTVNPTLASGHDALRSYFGPPAKNKPQVKMGGSTVTVLSDSAVVLVGFYEFYGPQPGRLLVTLPARYTFVVARRDDQWRIVHHHSSARPALNRAR